MANIVKARRRHKLGPNTSPGLARIVLCTRGAVGRYDKHKKRTASLGAYSGDPGTIGTRLCIMLDMNFRELRQNEVQHSATPTG